MEICMNSVLRFPMPAKQRGERVKGIRMEPSLVARIDKAGAATGIRSFSDRVRHLLTLGLAPLERSSNRSRKAA